MKLLTKMILCLVFAGYSFFLSAQDTKKHAFGLQLNPYLNDLFFTGTSIMPVYALRYSYSATGHISFGPEISGYRIRMLNTDPNFTISHFNIGGFFRYSFLPDSRIKPFGEISPYYTFSSYKNGPENVYGGMEPEGKSNYFSGYIAPGISLFNKSGRVSLDLMYKFSNNYFVNGKNAVFSYRLNIRF